MYELLPIQARNKLTGQVYRISRSTGDNRSDMGDLVLERPHKLASYFAGNNKAPVRNWADWAIELIERPGTEILTPEEADQLIADQRAHEQSTIEPPGLAEPALS